MEPKGMVKRRVALVGAGMAAEMNSAEAWAQVRINFRHFVGGTLFVCAALIFFWYYLGFPLANMRFTHGYPRFATPPSPNTFHSDRYTWGWVFIYVGTALNYMLLVVFTAALANNGVPEFAQVHRFMARITGFMNLVWFVGMSVSWLVFCNRFFPDYSYCHDIRWCCEFFSSNPTWCPNTTPCSPSIGAGQLARSDEFFQVWLFSLLFTLWTLAHGAVNRSLRAKGMWREVAQVTSTTQMQQ